MPHTTERQDLPAEVFRSRVELGLAPLQLGRCSMESKDRIEMKEKKSTLFGSLTTNSISKTNQEETDNDHNDIVSDLPSPESNTYKSLRLKQKLYDEQIRVLQQKQEMLKSQEEQIELLERQEKLLKEQEALERKERTRLFKKIQRKKESQLSKLKELSALHTFSSKREVSQGNSSTNAVKLPPKPSKPSKAQKKQAEIVARLALPKLPSTKAGVLPSTRMDTKADIENETQTVEKLSDGTMESSSAKAQAVYAQDLAPIAAGKKPKKLSTKANASHTKQKAKNIGSSRTKPNKTKSSTNTNQQSQKEFSLPQNTSEKLLQPSIRKIHWYEEFEDEIQGLDSSASTKYMKVTDEAAREKNTMPTPGIISKSSYEVPYGSLPSTFHEQQQQQQQQHMYYHSSNELSTSVSSPAGSFNSFQGDQKAPFDTSSNYKSSSEAYSSANVQKILQKYKLATQNVT